jgi:hypothetical protein
MKADWRTGVLDESHRQLAAAWGWTVPKVHRFLIRLEREFMIQKCYADYSLIETKKVYRIAQTIRTPIHIAICNYWQYQKDRNAQRYAQRNDHNKGILPLSFAVVCPKEHITMSASEPVEVQPDLIPPPKKEIYRERDPVALHLASFLVAAIKRTDNGDFPHKPKIPKDVALGSKGWASTLRLMITNDGHSADEIKETILWLYGDNLRSETSFVVMSPTSLRSKWDRIQLQRKRKDKYI